MAWRIAVVTESGDEKLEMSMDELKGFVMACAGNDKKTQKAIEAGFAMADKHLRNSTISVR